MGKNILCIEDNPDNMLLVKRVLQFRGYNLLEAANGTEGLATAEAQPVDLILLDINLPDLDGYEVARRLRSSSKLQLAYIPIIAITANALKGDAEKALESGCDVYMSKPINIRELWARVEGYVPAMPEPAPAPIVAPGPASSLSPAASSNPAPGGSQASAPSISSANKPGSSPSPEADVRPAGVPGQSSTESPGVSPSPDGGLSQARSAAPSSSPGLDGEASQPGTPNQTSPCSPSEPPSPDERINPATASSQADKPSPRGDPGHADQTSQAEDPGQVTW